MCQRITHRSSGHWRDDINIVGEAPHAALRKLMPSTTDGGDCFSALCLGAETDVVSGWIRRLLDRVDVL